MKSTKTKWKICGMKYPENILQIATLKPDYMGFIFWEKSSRFIENDVPELPSSIKKVGVFVDATLEFIQEKMEKHRLNVVQLHGNESALFCSSLKMSFEGEIIKAFSIGETFDFEVLKNYLDTVDFFLFDTKGKLPGGNGTCFDWQILTKYPFSKPFFLSGGIGLEQVETLNNMELPIYGLDINSKFEIQAGEKDYQKIKTFISLWNPR